MYIFIAPNEEINEGEKSFLTADSLASATKLNVERASDYAANDFIRIGRGGNEKTELRKISSITGNELTLSVALTNAHKEGDEIMKVYFDQRKLYKETAVGSGVYAALTGLTNPKTIEFDNPDGTIFQDTAGSASYRYKCTYYNSQTGTESSLDDAVATFGGDSGAYCSIDDIRLEAGFGDNANIDDGQILKMRKKAESEINSAIESVYSIPLSYVPEIITDIAKLLSAGRLLSQQYQGVEPLYEKSGKAKLNEARDLLKKITERKLILLNESGVALAMVSTASPSGWPNSTTADEDEDNAGGGRMFTRLKKF